MYILTNAKETCRYDHATETFFLGGATSGSNSVNIALSQTATESSIDGLLVEVTVRHIDQLESVRYETLWATYDASANTLTRTRTISSSSGTTSIAFAEELITDNLVIYGTTSHASFRGEDWHDVGAVGEISFENSWENYAFGTFPPVGYKKLPNGILILRGMAANGSAADVRFFTLPDGYRPSYNMFVATNSNDAHCRLQLETTGVVKAVSGGSTQYVNLDVMFYLGEDG